MKVRMKRFDEAFNLILALNYSDIYRIEIINNHRTLWTNRARKKTGGE
jgi:hypothetical protein